MVGIHEWNAISVGRCGSYLRAEFILYLELCWYRHHRIETLVGTSSHLTQQKSPLILLFDTYCTTISRYAFSKHAQKPPPQHPLPLSQQSERLPRTSLLHHRRRLLGRSNVPPHIDIQTRIQPFYFPLNSLLTSTVSNRKA